MEHYILLVEKKGINGCNGGVHGQYWHIYNFDTKIGIAYIKPVLSEGVLCGSISIELNKSCQGKGLGTACLKKVCESSYFNVIYATTRKSNLAFQKIAFKAGFIRVENNTNRQMLLRFEK